MPVALTLEGKTALVTGGSRGIGAAIVRLFAQAGARVAFSYERARAQARALADACDPDRVTALQATLESAGAGRELVTQAVEILGRLDILVANHGIWPPEDVPIDEMRDEQWGRTIRVNLDAVFGLVTAGVAAMKAQPRADASSARGRIVLIASTAAQRGEAFHCDYAASKGALISMTKGLSTELAPERIYVNCVAPGWVDTDMAAGALADPVAGPRALRAIPLGRVGTPDEIAGPVLFLCTEWSNFITGEVLNVNGGAVLAG
jgi:3-oxoacyl-[acyl-carrier protein] reductase